MHTMMKSLLAVGGLALAVQAGAQITLYSGEGFHGRQMNVDRPMWDLDRTDFNDRASSIVVQGGDWQVCEDARFQGRCVILRPGEYPSLDRMGMNDRISSVRPAGAYRPAEYQAPEPPPPPQTYEYQQRQGEALYQAQVTSVRAVVGPPEQRCWVERERVEGGANVPGAIVGGIVGGVLGHQIGSGRGRDVATAGGAVAGAAVGANVGRGGYSQDVQHCENVSQNMRPDYWDVTYEFRGQEHRAQLSSPPGRTITVNEYGEPRA
jgi:uncharacterized protein YcfJ